MFFLLAKKTLVLLLTDHRQMEMDPLDNGGKWSLEPRVAFGGFLMEMAAAAVYMFELQ